LTQYEYANFDPYDATKPWHTVNMTSPKIGTWYVGAYAFTTASFKIVVRAARMCPSNCSGPSHGYCVGSHCSCSNAYTGSYCETMRNTVALDTNYTGVIAQGAWNYYRVSVGSTNTLGFFMEHGKLEDCDLYVSENGNPSLTNYSYRDVVSPTLSKIVIEHPAFTTYHVGIYGFLTCKYNFSISLIATNRSCECVRGTCNNGICICPPGYTGVRCESSDGQIARGQTVSSSVGNEQWVYYTYSVSNCSQFLIVLKEMDSFAMISLYIQYLQAPTSTYFLGMSGNQEKSHRLLLTFNPRYLETMKNQTLIFIIGVKGASTIPNGQHLNYKLVAWNPPF